jgi:SAM-dependent methyltransferase
MSERTLSDEKAREFFTDLWKEGDPWDFERSEYEQARCVHLLRLLAGRRYGRVLEIGCAGGHFTRLLTGIAEQVVALDIAPAAIDKARALGAGPGGVEFRVANIMDYTWREDGPWDLVVMSDTICYLGWLYSFFDVAWLASELFAATHAGGRLLLANSMGGEDALLLPWLIRTYRDLFLNVGYGLAAEEIYRGTKNSVEFEVLISLFEKGPVQGSA